VSSLETGIRDTGSATASARGKLIEAACASRSMLNTFGELERVVQVPPCLYSTSREYLLVILAEILATRNWTRES
jgi:hypothetical protein